MQKRKELKEMCNGCFGCGEAQKKKDDIEFPNKLYLILLKAMLEGESFTIVDANENSLVIACHGNGRYRIDINKID